MRLFERCLWLLLAAAAGIAAAAGPDSIYRWVDDQGRLHLSDKPPPPDAHMAEELRVPSYAEPERPADEAPFSILNQLKRLETSRRALQRERQEQQQRDREYYLRRRELEAREQAAAQPPARRAVWYGVPGPRPPRPPLHPPGRPKHPQHPANPRTLWEPDHPAYRPPGRPPARHGPISGGRVDPGH